MGPYFLCYFFVLVGNVRYFNIFNKHSGSRCLWHSNQYNKTKINPFPMFLTVSIRNSVSDAFNGFNLVEWFQMVSTSTNGSKYCKLLVHVRQPPWCLRWCKLPLFRGRLVSWKWNCQFCVSCLSNVCPVSMWGMKTRNRAKCAGCGGQEQS